MVAQAVRKDEDTQDIAVHIVRRLKEGAFIILGAFALFLLLAIVSHHPADPGWTSAVSSDFINNKGGVAGAWLADILLHMFGYLAYLFPAMIGALGWFVYRGHDDAEQIDYFYLTTRGVGFLLTLVLGCGLAWAHMRGNAYLPQDAGGIVGDVTGKLLVSIFGGVGGTLLMLSLFLTGITLFTGLSWLWVTESVGDYTLRAIHFSRRWGVEAVDYIKGQQARREREELVRVETLRVESRPKPVIEAPPPVVVVSDRAEKERQNILFDDPPNTALPPLNLLDQPMVSEGGYSKEVLEAMSRQVELKLKDFGVEVEVVAVLPGPVITRFELRPAAGVKASRITNLSKDLARSLSTISVRVVEVIPGKSVIGLEIPNERREIVNLSEILNSREYEASTSPLSLALGKDISGGPVVVDLARMPHLLVAGTTGAGKSVALNAMILSLLYKATAQDVRLIMIDPKMLELSVYEGIPPLLAPVVTDMKEAANALRWCVAEMERRYRLMSMLGVRNIGGYNRKVQDAEDAKKPILDPIYQPVNEDDQRPALSSLPQIVVIVDELADMMMTTGKKVEELIARLAQKARAAGIHLILATQRPSVDVITGLIKANIPCRIAFQVSSRVDSRTILDQMGAENLLGHGDMLYLPAGTSIPIRVHGAFVSDQEVHKVVDNLKARGEPAYLDEIVNGPADGDSGSIPGFSESNDDADELYDQAVRIVTETRRASVSGVQRRLKIGYNRAARMIEEMERSGVVGELQSNGTREVLAPPPPKD
jgi:S-DNA-T family DNA segregation ATPase FtsK/SpoIIIE